MVETFEAREKKIGSIRIVKNPNFPSGTSLQAYIKTNRAELRKVFGNPNMGESGDGKSKGKEWNLIVGPHRVTIYDRREMGKKGTKYFNIGGDGKYGALLVAQALSIHRNERVHAKEIVPQWIEDRRQYQQVKSIDEHPDLTYERAKEYEDNRRRYRAETFEDFKRKMVGDKAVAGDVGYMEALEEFYEDYLEDFERITDEFCPEPETFEEFQERVLKNDYEMSLEAEEDYVDYTMWIYTKSTGGLFNGEWEDGESEEQVVKEWKELVREAIEENGDDLITADLRKHSNYDEDGVAQSSEFLFQYEHGEDNLDDFEAEDDLTFKEWADQEMMTHGGRESFDDWLNDELKSHGDDITLSDWGHHELDSHYERYGSEALDYEDRLKLLYEDFLANWEKENPDSDNPPSFDEWTDLVMEQNPAMFDAEGFRTMGGRGFQIEFKNGYTISVMFGEGSYGDHYNDPDFDYEDSREYLESSQAEVAIRKPNGQIMLEILGWTSPDFVAALIPVVATGDEAEMIEVIQNREHREAEDMNWGGDPKGKLATALRNARIKAKQPKKPLKIEKLEAAPYTLGYSYDNPPDDEDPLPEWYEEYLKDEEWKDMGLTEPESFEDYSKRITKEYDEYLENTGREMREYDEYVQERMDAEFLYYYVLNEKGESPADFDTLEEAQAYVANSSEPLEIYERRSRDDEAYKMDKKMNAETSGQWEIGEQLEEAQMNAEDKKRKKLSGVLSDPFDELSLDSGDWKSIVIGFGVGLLGLFGYSKLRK